jgi:hypothetical protein
MHTKSASIQNTSSNNNTKPIIPKPILTICILGFIGSGLSALGLLLSWSELSSLGSLFMLYYVLSVAAGFLSLLWLAQMKKKGAYLYAGLFVVSQAVLLIYGAFEVSFTFLIGLAVTAIALYYTKDMQ